MEKQADKEADKEADENAAEEANLSMWEVAKLRVARERAKQEANKSKKASLANKTKDAPKAPERSRRFTGTAKISLTAAHEDRLQLDAESDDCAAVPLLVWSKSSKDGIAGKCILQPPGGGAWSISALELSLRTNAWCATAGKLTKLTLGTANVTKFVASLPSHKISASKPFSIAGANHDTPRAHTTPLFSFMAVTLYRAFLAPR